MSNPTPPPRPPRKRWRDLRASAKAALVLFVVVLTLGCLELLSRVYWTAIKGASPPSQETIWRTFYPEMADSGVDRVAPHHGDATFDVLLLGGSVLHPAYGSVAARLGPALEARLGRKVRVVNLSFLGMTSRDSLLKYARLSDKRFDLVLVYDGINDVHLNNCPPSVFRADYSHATRYAQLYALDAHREAGWFVLPYTAQYIALNLGERWHWNSSPRREFQQYGGDVHTPPCLEANLDALAALAEQRGDRLALLTFAYYLPSDYSDEAFKAKRLDYDRHSCPATMWGEPHNLAHTLELHNEAVRRVAARRGLPLIDQQRLIPDGKRYYNDPCHLTEDGCARWVENVVEGLDLSKRDGRGGR
jgi:hypothetical protein